MAGMMASTDENFRVRRRGGGSLLVILLVAIVLFAIALHLGKWLVIDEPLEKADAILVLSGGLPGRALEAARVYKQGYAQKVWLTYSAEPGATLAEYRVDYTGEEIYDKRLLMQQGVPESAIRVLAAPIVNTADEVRAAGMALQQEPLHKIILVTSKVHTRRVRVIWKRLAAKDGTAILHGVSDDEFDPGHWWKSTKDMLDVVREVLGLLNAWAGFPLQPAS
jgi:uncharacterized SAM-binding protein YcdF (DUF218 family)